MLSYNELKPGVYIVINNEPWKVENFEFLRMQQRKPVAKTKIRSLINGRVQEWTFHQNEELEEAEIEKIGSKFLYSRRGEFWFVELNNPKNRFILKSDILGEAEKFLKPNLEITALRFSPKGGESKIINIELPIKADYKVIEAPPTIRGDTAQGGTKTAVIETGAKILVPLFIKGGDIIRVNTETSGYIERIK